MRYQFITLCHPGTFSKNLEINCKIVCYFNVSDLMCIYCHYRRLRTHYSLDMSRFHQIYNFMILLHPRTLMVVQNKKKLLSHYYVHQTKFPIIPLQTFSDLSLSELKLLPYYLFYVVKGNLCHPGTLWLSEDVFMHILCWIKKSWEICQWNDLTPFRITKRSVTLKCYQYCVCYNHLKMRTLLSQSYK